MGFKEQVKNTWFRSKKMIIGAGTLVIALIVLANYSCHKANAKKNNFTGAETTQQGREGAGAMSSGGMDQGLLPGMPGESDLPDLAEAIARFSREMEAAGIDPDREAFVESFWRWIFGEAGLPERLAREAAASALESPSFVMELIMVLQNDPYTFYLVDKAHPLPEGYEPPDLVPLRAENYKLGRDGLMLRKMAADALEEMAAASAGEGIILTAGSAYRSAAYQAQVYEREVAVYGKEAADRESAQTGKSQHQLGLVMDFAPIDDAFSKTPASRWLLENGSRFGWSLSFPDGYEELTGYRWESWHYRYVGKDLAAFIDNYFEGIQQYALQFIHAWQEQAGN